MRTETGASSDKDMVRELTLAETNEVVGGVGLAEVVGLSESGTGSTLSASGSFSLSTSNTFALAVIALNNITTTGANNTVQLEAIAAVF